MTWDPEIHLPNFSVSCQLSYCIFKSPGSNHGSVTNYCDRFFFLQFLQAISGITPLVTFRLPPSTSYDNCFQVKICLWEAHCEIGQVNFIK
jgi:hypothetical protein